MADFNYMMLDGNSAAVRGMKKARVKVISAYPITPQSSIAEELSQLVENGNLNAKYIRVESEHSAMSAAITAQLTGVRAATATSSVGLALMHEVLNVASGCRVPLVMPVVNRALVSPWSLWCDHQDTMAERDSGWLQLYCENVQDVLDYVIMAYKIAEHKDVLTPIMVCLDGFFLSHSMQKVQVPSQEKVDRFLGDYVRKNAYLDSSDPMNVNNLVSSEQFTEMRYQQKVGFDNSAPVMDEVFGEFEAEFGRRHRAVEGHMLEDAEAVIVSLGSMSGTVKHVVNELRAKGEKVGALKVVSFRPFRADLVAEMLEGINRVAVIDRTAGLGAQGAPLWQEVSNALGKTAYVKNYIAGLGGRDVSMGTINNIFKDIRGVDSPHRSPVWIDLSEQALDIRQVLVNA